jgi:hypothetical protein
MNLGAVIVIAPTTILSLAKINIGVEGVDESGVIQKLMIK